MVGSWSPFMIEIFFLIVPLPLGVNLKKLALRFKANHLQHNQVLVHEPLKPRHDPPVLIPDFHLLGGCSVPLHALDLVLVPEIRRDTDRADCVFGVGYYERDDVLEWCEFDELGVDLLKGVDLEFRVADPFLLAVDQILHV